LKLLPLTFDRELKDFVFFDKCLNGLTDLNLSDFVSFVSHGRIRLSNSFNLKTPVCTPFKFNRLLIIICILGFFFNIMGDDSNGSSCHVRACPFDLITLHINFISS